MTQKHRSPTAWELLCQFAELLVRLFSSSRGLHQKRRLFIVA